MKPERLAAFTDGVIENSNGEWEDKDAAHVFYTTTPGSR